MYKKIRKSFAETVATLENPEQFQWTKWLREPQTYLERFPKPRIAVKSIDTFKSFEKPSLFQVSKFTLSKSRVSEGIRSVVIKKRKTFKIFFTFPKTYQQRITIFSSDAGRLIFLLSIYFKDKELFIRTKTENNETIQSAYPKSISKDIEPFAVSVRTHQVKLQKTKQLSHDFILTIPENVDYKINVPTTLPSNKVFSLDILRNKTQKKYLALAFNQLNKKTVVKSIPVIKLDDLKEQLEKEGKKKIIELPLEKLSRLPKHYRVKFAPIEKIKVPLFHLKNLGTKSAKQTFVEFDPLDKVELNVKNLCPSSPGKGKVIDPGILKALIPVEVVEPKKKVRKPKPKKEETATEVKQFEGAGKSIIWENLEPELKSLQKYQIEGVKLLLTNNTALLCDELGIDKKDQVIHTLNTAMQHDMIKTALIVCPESHFGNISIGSHFSNAVGWENQINKINPELSFYTLHENIKDSNLEELGNYGIYLTSYKTFFEFTNDNSNEKFRHTIDCLILDEAQYLFNSEIQTEQLFNFPQSKHKWILTSLPSQIIEERLLPKLRNHVVGFENLDSSLNRTKQSLGTNLPSIIRNDFWLEPDKEQAQEFENTILQGRKRILDLVKGGNPFIIQSNIFTLVHQIKQLGNFSTHKETSPKSDLLLDQLESIIASGQKCIVFSQYDKQGIQKIEHLLKSNQIRFALYQSGMPLKELENSANTFKKDSKISVMLAGLTAASIKVKIPEASYLIHFDQWWNPITQWQYEEKTINLDELNQSLESINVINYFGNNSIEIRIRETLQRKGLLVKNLVESLSNETIYSLISNEDWLDILGIDQADLQQNSASNLEMSTQKITESSLDEIGQKSKLLFTKLGYKNLLIKPDMLHEELTIFGTAMKGLHEIKTAIFCLPFKVKDIEPAKAFIKEASKNNTRIFVICSSEICEQVSADQQEKIVYIDQQMFANYLMQFKII